LVTVKSQINAGAADDISLLLHENSLLAEFNSLFC
jgi:hypothetical protein